MYKRQVQERAVGQDVLNSLTPGQMVIKIVNEELVNLMGSETTEIELKAGGEITVIMMAGLQGAGKTTTPAKLAGKFKSKGKKPLLAACDVYRPAAIEQLQINGDKQGVPVFSMGTGNKPVNIAKAALEHASKNGFCLLYTSAWRARCRWSFRSIRRLSEALLPRGSRWRRLKAWWHREACPPGPASRRGPAPLRSALNSPGGGPGYAEIPGAHL